MTDGTSPRRDAANGVRVPHADGRNGAGAYPSDPPTLLRASERADGGWLSGACTDPDDALEADVRRVVAAADPPPPALARPLIAISEHRCVQDDGTEVDDEWTMCSGGILYGPCEYPTCGGTCQIIGDCECNCHTLAVSHG